MKLTSFLSLKTLLWTAVNGFGMKSGNETQLLWMMFLEQLKKSDHFVLQCFTTQRGQEIPSSCLYELENPLAPRHTGF